MRRQEFTGSATRYFQWRVEHSQWYHPFARVDGSFVVPDKGTAFLSVLVARRPTKSDIASYFSS